MTKALDILKCAPGAKRHTGKRIFRRNNRSGQNRRNVVQGCPKSLNIPKSLLFLPNVISFRRIYPIHQENNGDTSANHRKQQCLEATSKQR